MCEEKQTVIIAPHADDEVIGCYNILLNGNPIIIYTTDMPQLRKEESLKLKDSINSIKGQFFLNTIPTHFFDGNHKFYVPDPIYEIHPEHRQIGFIGEQMARNGLDVIFYTVNMAAPYIRNLDEDIITAKENLLNKIYPSQKKLWEYDKKYVLFEGYCKWIF